MVKKLALSIAQIIVVIAFFQTQAIFAQDLTAQTVVKHIQSRLENRDSTLSDYTVQMDMKYLDYKDETPKVEQTEHQEWIFQNGELVERKSSAENESNQKKSTETDTTKVTKEMKMGDPLAIFQSPDEYNFHLKNPPSDSLLIVQVTPKNPTKESYKGTFTLRKSDLKMLRADLKPGANIPHVTSAETKVTFTQFEGFPVTKTVQSRFTGKYLIFFSFDKGIQITMHYLEGGQKD